MATPPYASWFPPTPAPPPEWAYRVNAAVAARFDAFAERLELTPLQQQDAATKVAGVVRTLNQAYWGIDSPSAHAFSVGSWGKGTQLRPPRDVDVLFQLPYAVYQQFQARQGNIQSALLQEVKDVLLEEYDTSRIRGDGQVVVVDFAQGHGVEVLPAFLAEGEGRRYLICDTHNGGRYKLIAPHAEIALVQTSDDATSGTTRDLIRMIKRWQTHCNVTEIRSFQLEILVKDYLLDVRLNRGSRAMYDYLVRDFFAFMLKFSGGYQTIRGTGERVELGDGWVTKAESAHARAVKASEYEVAEMPHNATGRWQMIFGTDIRA